MSSYFHIMAGSAIAVGSHKAVGIELWTKPFVIWMLILIAASNIADKDVISDLCLKWWKVKPESNHVTKRIYDCCNRWFAHRKFCHSIIGLMLDLKSLILVTSLLQGMGLLPAFNPMVPLLIALVLHLFVDTVDGSVGIAPFSPSSDWMLKLPALFQDCGWDHMLSSDPTERAMFRFRVKIEGALVAGLFLPATVASKLF